MAFEFHETIDLTLPQIRPTLDSFTESEFNSSHGLIVEINAIHAGATANYNYYSADELERSLSSWTTPYSRPIIMNHDPHSEPIGRVMGATMAQEADGTPYVKLQAAILDPEAIKKVADGRYLTGSVGGKAEEAVCSICNTDWASPREGAGLPCRHQRGKVYKGEVAFLNVGNISFKEYSIVNMPADSNSTIKTLSGAEAQEAEAKFFLLDMNEENIQDVNLGESVNILESMRKKDARPMYLGLKGAFLTAKALYEADEEENVILYNSDTTNGNDLNSDKEREMARTSTNPVETEDKDILDVLEGLADEASEPESVEAPEASDSEQVPSDETPDEVPAEDTPEDAPSGEEPEAQESERSEGQEKPAPRVDPETSKGAPINREGEDENGETTAVVEPEPETPEQTPEDQPEPEAPAEEPELTEPSQEESVDEPQVAELEDRIAQLEDENTRLRSALHRALVERVVDAKISKGLVTSEDRKTAVEEHSARTASSLVDSLKDTMAMPDVAQAGGATNAPKVNETSLVVENESNATTIDADDEVVEEVRDPYRVAEDTFVDIFMGRKKA